MKTKEWTLRERDLTEELGSHWGIYPKGKETAGQLIASIKSLSIADNHNYNRDGGYGQTSEEALANAKLIAAAPELLKEVELRGRLIQNIYNLIESSKNLEELGEGLCGFKKTMENALKSNEDAIKKATSKGSPVMGSFDENGDLL